MPRPVSASSKVSDWALMRNSTAISPSARPLLRSAATRAATASASATSSDRSPNSTAAPEGCWARSATPWLGEPASNALAAPTISGVER